MPALWPGAGDGNRTRVSCLEGRCSTIELHRRICLPAMPNREAGETGIEPAFCWRSVTYGKANCIQRSCGREVCNRILDPYISCKQPDTPFVCPAGLKVPAERCLNCRLSALSAKMEGDSHAAMRPRCWWRMEGSNLRAAHLCCAAGDVTAPPRFPAPVLHIPGVRLSGLSCVAAFRIATVFTLRRSRLSGCQIENRKRRFHSAF